MKGRGAVVRATKALAKIAKSGDRADLDALQVSETYMLAMRHAPKTISEAHAAALLAIEERLPPLTPGPVRAHWTAEMVARFKSSWARHNGNTYRVGRELGITEPAAYRAHRRFILAGATPTAEKPPRKARDGRALAGTPSTSGQKNAPATLSAGP